jgi:hypothetical protein
MTNYREQRAKEIELITDNCFSSLGYKFDNNLKSIADFQISKEIEVLKELKEKCQQEIHNTKDWIRIADYIDKKIKERE